jgi:formylglycine-generating enzyme required for sulfatase activity
MSVLSVAAGALATVASLAAPSHAGVVTFGSGANQFNMEFVTIGNPGNAADTTGNPNPAGAVGYTYGIGKFEVSREMITKYNSAFGTDNNLAITLAAYSGVTGGPRGAMPASGITWNAAARFVNWLNVSSGYAPAYKFTSGGVDTNIALWAPGDAGYDVNNRYRNSLARFVLPNINEWYKAAFYDPNKSGGAGYYDWATGSDTKPTAVAGGTGVNTAVYANTYAQGPADVTNAGGLSPYGVMGLGGNVWEFQESSFDQTNSAGSLNRMVRGGDWNNNQSDFPSALGRVSVPSNSLLFTNDWIGFRVTEVVPEPSMMVIGTLFGLGGLVAKRRRKK